MVMATAYKIGEPARVGRWGLTVDSLTRPGQYVVLRYANEHRRHTEPFEEVRRIPYLYDDEAAIAALGQVGMAKGTATQLVVQVELKRISPKAADADSGIRPVR